MICNYPAVRDNYRIVSPFSVFSPKGFCEKPDYGDTKRICRNHAANTYHVPVILTFLLV